MVEGNQNGEKPFRKQLKEKLEQLDKYLTYKNQPFCRNFLNKIIRSLEV